MIFRTFNRPPWKSFSKAVDDYSRLSNCVYLSLVESYALILFDRHCFPRLSPDYRREYEIKWAFMKLNKTAKLGCSMDQFEKDAREKLDKLVSQRFFDTEQAYNRGVMGMENIR